MRSPLRKTISGCLLSVLLFSAKPVQAQTGTSAPRPLRNFDSPNGRWPAATREIKCKIKKFKPSLSFEFRFFSGYLVEIPIRQLVGPPNELLIRVIVTPLSVEGKEPGKFQQVLEVKEIKEGQKGALQFAGSFALGEGKYNVHWQLRDRFGRYCGDDWTVKAKLSGKDRDLDLTLSPGEVAPPVVYLFRPETSVQGGDRSLRIKLLVSMDVRLGRRVTFHLGEYAPLVSILRRLSRHPSLVEFSVVAFSLEDQEILFRQDYADHIDFPALGKALDDLSPGTVNFQELRKGKEEEFFGSLLETELGQDNTADAFVFVGSDVRIDKKAPKETINSLRELQTPVFYLNPSRHPWRGMLAKAVNKLDGKEYKIRRPRQLSSALEKIVSRIIPSAQGNGDS